MSSLANAVHTNLYLFHVSLFLCCSCWLVLFIQTIIQWTYSFTYNAYSVCFILYGLIKYVICFRQVIYLFHFHFRQVKEGCGLIIEEEDLTMYGTLDYEFLDKAETMYVHVFLVTHFSGVIKKTDGMAFTFLSITFTK